MLITNSEAMSGQNATLRQQVNQAQVAIFLDFRWVKAQRRPDRDANAKRSSFQFN
jgi:hypothetical protein